MHVLLLIVVALFMYCSAAMEEDDPDDEIKSKGSYSVHVLQNLITRPPNMALLIIVIMRLHLLSAMMT